MALPTEGDVEEANWGGSWRWWRGALFRKGEEVAKGEKTRGSRREEPGGLSSRAQGLGLWPSAAVLEALAREGKSSLCPVRRLWNWRRHRA